MTMAAQTAHPIVHNGIIYLANTANSTGVDGRTGELIWENHIDPTHH